VHAAGIDEPRLATFAREIAATGHPVVTVELPDLAGYRITPRSTDMIEDAARQVAAAWAPRMRENERAIGIAGISFAGGLSVVAASRLDGTAAWVLSLGGHGDLPRTLRYLCGAELPAGARPPHDYGVVIILLELAGKLVPAEQVDPLLNGVRTFLQASHEDMVDKAASARTFESARRLEAALPEPARTVMGWVNNRDVGRLGPALLPHISSMGLDPALSPERNAPPALPVHLLHGADDNVVPSAETASLAAYLEARGAEVSWLTTPLITHAEVDRGAAAGEIWRLVRFWAELL
jgi:dienelactone hydrolase